MKKHVSFAALAALLLAFALLCGGCTKIPLPSFESLWKSNPATPACEHEYGEGEVSVAATCEREGTMRYTCAKCGKIRTEKIPAAGHTYGDPTAAPEVTCTVAGELTYTCTVCGAEKTETGTLPHVADAEWHHDAEGHYHLCVNGCGEKLDQAAHVCEETVETPWNCMTNGTARYTCACGYTYTEPKGGQHYYDLVSEILPTCVTDGVRVTECSGCHDVKNEILPHTGVHEYGGDVCVHCRRDRMLDYLDKFTAGGDTAATAVTVSSEEELICFFNYSFLHGITTPRFFKLTYECGDRSAYISSVYRQISASTWPISYGSSGEAMFIQVKDEGDNLRAARATVAFDDGTYTDIRLPQIDSIQYAAAPHTRDALTVLPYESRANALAVSGSDQLFYAFSHGYRPEPAAGSAAGTVLAAAREILLDIIDDGMTDTEKLWAIYSWFVENVQYDKGAVAYSDGHSWTPCRAWAPEGALLDHVAVCDSISQSFAILAGMEDIVCIQVSGEGHAWNKVYVDADGDGTGEWYVIDATYANTAIGTDEVMMLSHFLLTDAKKKDVAVNAKGTAATTTFDVYSFLHYDTVTPDASNDFLVETEAELRALVDHFATEIAGITEAVTIEIRVPDTLGESVGSIVLNELAAKGVTTVSLARSFGDWDETTVFYTLIFRKK